MKKRILCYGDSNTWGYVPAVQPEDGSYFVRYEDDVRWTGILAKRLGEDYTIIEEGLNGRTTVSDDVNWPGRNGLTYLLPCLNSHEPIDLVIIMLGTNDLKLRISGYAPDIAMGAGCLIDVVKQANCGRMGACPEILFVAPILTGKNIKDAGKAVYDDLGGENSYTQSLRFGELYAEQARIKKVHFMDAAKYAETACDSIHMTPENHQKLADAFYSKITEILSGK